jgi:hypothetical protein
MQRYVEELSSVLNPRAVDDFTMVVDPGLPRRTTFPISVKYRSSNLFESTTTITTMTLRGQDDELELFVNRGVFFQFDWRESTEEVNLRLKIRAVGEANRAVNYTIRSLDDRYIQRSLEDIEISKETTICELLGSWQSNPKTDPGDGFDEPPYISDDEEVQDELEDIAGIQDTAGTIQQPPILISGEIIIISDDDEAHDQPEDINRIQDTEGTIQMLIDSVLLEYHLLFPETTTA